MMKIPPFWRRLQLRANPTRYHALRRVDILQRQKKITARQAHEIRQEIQKVA